MTDQQNWRVDVNAETYFGHQKKQVAVADRRPVIRKASDLVGPGIAAEAVAITDFNDLLATYNGYFSAEIGAFGAPNEDEAFVGFTVGDATLGGVQTFTGMGEGEEAGDTYRRRFRRNPSDAASIFWDPWENLSGGDVEGIGLISACPKSVPPEKHLVCDGSTYDDEEYPLLYAFLGTTTLPDLRDRTIYGVGDEWGLGETDGLSYGNRVSQHSHSVSTSDAGSHFHTVVTTPAPNHDHSIPDNAGNVSRSDGALQAAPAAHDHGGSTGLAGGHSHDGTALSAGTHSHGGSSGNALVTLPGVGMLWVIRAA